MSASVKSGRLSQMLVATLCRRCCQCGLGEIYFRETPENVIIIFGKLAFSRVPLEPSPPETHMRMRVCMYVCVYIYIYTNVFYVYSYTHMHMCTCIHVNIYIYIDIATCLHTYVCIYMQYKGVRTHNDDGAQILYKMGTTTRW